MINKLIRTMRIKADLTQLELAKRCNIANSTISGYETGYREPDLNTLFIIAKECGFEMRFVNKKNDILTIDNIKRKEL